MSNKERRNVSRNCLPEKVYTAVLVHWREVCLSFRERERERDVSLLPRERESRIEEIWKKKRKKDNQKSIAVKAELQG